MNWWPFGIVNDISDNVGRPTEQTWRTPSVFSPSKKAKIEVVTSTNGKITIIAESDDGSIQLTMDSDGAKSLVDNLNVAIAAAAVVPKTS